MNLKDFGLPGGKRKTLFVLGAGASRGASFVSDSTIAQPPLDLDFFQQLARMEQSNEFRRLVEFIRSEYGHEVGLSMEQFFSEADYTDRFHHDLNVDPGPVVRRYRKALEDFLRILPRMLNQTTSANCEYHLGLARALHTQDCVISFNYDCLMDRALRDAADRRWDPEKGGYGFEVSSGATDWRSHTGGRPVKKSIRLLKMHGSLNWAKTNPNATSNAWGLVADTSEVTDLSGSIIPPTWFKNLTTAPFGDVWRVARREIRTSRIMVVVGYSVPQTDLFSRSLFKVEAGSKEKRERLDLLVLVNPDSTARRRFLEVVREGIEPSTRILEYETLRQLSHVITTNGGGRHDVA